MHTQTDDNSLIEQVLAGDNNAYAILVARHQSFVFSLALRYAKTREDAEEIAQDVFVKAYRSLKDYKAQAKFTTWLYTIATTTSLSFLRKKRPDIRSLDTDQGAAAADNWAGGIAADTIELKSRAALVNRALTLLSSDDARVLMLFYKGEQTLEEMAAILNKEPNAVKVQLHRARTRLKEKMQTHFTAELKDIL